MSLASFSHWPSRLAPLWQRLTEPAAALQSPEHRRQARLLAVLHVVLTPLYSIYVLARNVSSVSTPYGEIVVVILIFAYGLSRTRHYLFGAALTVSVISALPFVTLVTRADNPTALTLTWGVWAVLLGYLLLSLRATVLVIVANVGGVSLLPLLVPEIRFVSLAPWLGFIASISLLILVAAVIRQRDVQQMERQAAELTKSESRYRVITELISDYAYAYRVDADGTWHYEWTTEDSFVRLTGFTSEEIANTTSLYHPDDVKRVEQHIEQTVRGQPTQGEYRILTKAGKLRWLSIHRRPEWDAQHKRVVRFYGVAQDITERKRVQEQQLELAVERERVEMLQHFIRDTSHDLRTPLTNIKTSLYLLRKTFHDQDKRERYLDALDEQTSHLQKLVEDLLSMSRLDKTASEDFKFELRSMNLLLQNVVAGQKRLATNKQHTLTLNVEDNLPPVLIDDGQLGRALSNILVNALNYTADGGQISVKAYRRHERFGIEIQDTGIGISPDDLPYIFDRFFRADRARNADTGGMGLGLTIARRIVEAHGGDIEVTSQLVKGSTFTVWLPVVPIT